MPTILRQFPFFEKHTTAAVPRGSVTVRPYQIVVWVSLHPMGRPNLPPSAPRFPAVLDLGHSHNFSITGEHLSGWAGFAPGALRTLGSIRIAGRRVPLVAANVWIHGNQVGQRDAFADRPPFCIQLDSGIAVYPEGTPAVPRLPLLGLRGLRRADLQLHVDCRKCLVSLHTARSFWPF
jgi:hypothetical protein